MEEQLKERLKKAEKSFEDLKRQRDDIDIELVRLQGEWRVVTDLLNKKKEKKTVANVTEEVSNATAN